MAALLALFYEFVNSVVVEEGEWEGLEAMMELRADHIIRRAFDAFGITFDEAIKLIDSAEDLDNEQLAKRKVVIAAVDNLVDFSVVEEYQMADEMSGLEETLSPEETSDYEEQDWWELYLPIFNKFNDRYARVEDGDVEHTMILAAYIATLRDETVLTYMTMGDNRVRPWHLQYEGYSAPKSMFPGWLVPPIEHGCRCYLVEESPSMLGSMVAKATEWPEKADWFNPTFKESVALGGRIFSDEHPYFQIDGRHYDRLHDIARRLKMKYHIYGYSGFASR